MRTSVVAISIVIRYSIIVFYLFLDFPGNLLFRETWYKPGFYFFKDFYEKSSHISSNRFELITRIEYSSRSDAFSLMNLITLGKEIKMHINLIFSQKHFPAGLILPSFISVYNAFEEIFKTITLSIQSDEVSDLAIMTINIRFDKFAKFI